MCTPPLYKKKPTVYNITFRVERCFNLTKGKMCTKAGWCTQSWWGCITGYTFRYSSWPSWTRCMHFPPCSWRCPSPLGSLGIMNDQNKTVYLPHEHRLKEQLCNPYIYCKINILQMWQCTPFPPYTKIALGQFPTLTFKTLQSLEMFKNYGKTAITPIS